MELDLQKIARKTFDQQLYTIIPKRDTIRITSNKRDGRPSKPLVLPKFLLVDKDFLIGFGIFYSEGTWATNGVSRVEAGNTDPTLLDYFIRYLGKFGIMKNELKIKIGIYKEDAAIRNPEKLKIFWSRKLRIPIINFQKVSFYSKVGSKRVASKFGVVQVRYYSTNLVRFMHTFKKEFLAIIKSDQDALNEFLKGIIASEGHVELRSSNSLKAVYIACKNTHKEIMDILSIGGINTKGYKEYNRCIKIQGIENFIKLHENSLVSVHPDKSNRFNRGLSNHRYFNRVIPSRRISQTCA